MHDIVLPDQWNEGAAAEKYLRYCERATLDIAFKSEPLLKLSPSVAISSLLQTYDVIHAFVPLAQIEGLLDNISVGSALGQLSNAIRHAIQWVTSNGTVTSAIPIDYQPLWRSSSSFLDLSIKYGMAAHCHIEYGAKLCELRTNSISKTIKFSKTYKEGDKIDIAMQLEVHPGELSSKTSIETTDNDRERSRYVQWRQSSGIKYQQRRLVLECQQTIVDCPMLEYAPPITSPREVVLGIKLNTTNGATVHDMHRFIAAFHKWCIAAAASSFSIEDSKSNIRMRSAVPTQIVPRDKFISIIGGISGLPGDTVEYILNILSLGKQTPSPSVHQQPFLSSDKYVAWSHAIGSAYALDDAIRLMSRIDAFKKTADAVLETRHGEMVSDVASLLRNKGFSALCNKVVRKNGVQAEIDVLGMAANDSPAIIIEIKSCLPARTLREKINNTERIAECSRQFKAIEKTIRCMSRFDLRQHFGELEQCRLVDAKYCCVYTPGSILHRLLPSDVIAAPVDIFRSVVNDVGSDTNQIVAELRKRSWVEDVRPTGVRHAALPIGGITYLVPCYQPLPQRTTVLHKGPIPWREASVFEQLADILNPKMLATRRRIEGKDA